MHAPNDAADPPPPPSPGRVDMHSHVLPGIDDGCATVAESLQSVRSLIAHGYVGTVCTPHCWPTQYAENTPRHIGGWVQALQQAIDQAGLAYTLWPGGELRLFPEVIAWMRTHGVPTLAGSRYVLCDFWDRDWPAFADDAFGWLLGEGYTPILAHPERTATPTGYEAKLDHWAGRGVLLQGNLQCFTGGAGRRAGELVRRYMDDGRYTLLALDLHRPDSLDSRLGGIAVASDAYGADTVESMIDRRVRELLWPGTADG